MKRGCEMEVCNSSGDSTIDFFREGLPSTVGAKTRFYMSNFRTLIKRRKASRRDSCSVALYKHPVWTFLS